MSFVADVIDQIPSISVITQIEALSWVNPDKKKEAIVRSFVTDATILPLTSDIVLQCVKIRRGQKIKTPDAIIAATAIVYNLTLVTSDSDFKNIDGLNSIDPMKL